MNNGHVKPHTFLPIANSIMWFAILNKYFYRSIHYFLLHCLSEIFHQDKLLFLFLRDEEKV